MITRTISSDDVPASGYLHWRDSHRSHQIQLGDFLSVGRESGNQLVLDDDYISSRHARIELRDGRFVIKDLRSRNGTFVNGARVTESWLSEGDRVRLGRAELRFSHYKKDHEELPDLTTKNERWKIQLDSLPKLAVSEFPILITGPSGSGKDILAQAIHRQSNRSAGPFIGVNCSALSEQLVESELFGHVRGSFTGATGDRKGAFEAARGGTLFLDEIGDLPASLQPKLLRALENNQIRPVGSDRSVATDVRVVAATHRDLKKLVAEGVFREDLYFRLHVLQLRSPALRDRIEDFEDLFYGFARRMRVRFSYAAIQKLRDHDWPGNIRELRNVVARAKAFYGEQEVLEEHVQYLIDTLQPGGRDLEELAFKPSRSVIKEIELEMIKSRLRANHGNQRRTAADLNMAKSTLNDRIRGFKINIKDLLGE